MWASTAIFIIAFIGLLSLFVLKALERRGFRVEPLLQLRRADSFVFRSWQKARRHMPVRFSQIVEVGYLFCKKQAHSAGVAVYTRLYKFSLWFGEYLKKHNAAPAKNPGAVSSYLKNMLEYKQETIQNTDKKETE